MTGCLAERYREEIFTELPEVDAVLGCGGIHNILDAIESVARKEKYSLFPAIESIGLGGERLVTTPSHYAYLKIAEGCDNRCTYCTIPSIRGRYRSRRPEEIIAEARELEALGARELILVAQDTTRYGKDFSQNVTLSTLIRDITEHTEQVRVRLLYCYPDQITDQLVAEIRDNDRVIKYVDLPIQHISDTVLRRMNRRGGSAAVRGAIKRLREQVPGIVLRTTLITGFPGESEEEFGQLCEFVAKTRFERLGVFPYSREEGTPAYDMPDQIDKSVAEERAQILLRNQMMISAAYADARVGEVLPVVCEGYDPIAERYYGRSDADAPEIDPLVYFTGEKGIKEGAQVNVKITDAINCDLIGEAL